MKGKSKEIQSGAEDAYRFGEFDLYPSDRRLFRQKKAVALPPKAFDALVILVRKAEQLVRKEELMEALWPDTYVMEANLTNTVGILRKTLGRDSIQTVSKFGYRFVLPVLGEPGVGPRAYATFVRAKELTGERSLESMVRARELLWLCIAENPGFAAAWAWLGRCCRFIDKFSGSGDRSENFELAQAAFLRALAIDSELACAHHFYTQLQGDCGESREAMVRLVKRLVRRGGEPESYAGLVQVFRFCGRLEESVAAHDRARALDPTIMTSVSHTHFLRGEYQAAIETYGTGTGYYLDAAAWAALSDPGRAVALLRQRVAASQLSPLMYGLMESLLAVLEDRRRDAVDVMTRTTVGREPEVLFYFARHFSMLGDAGEAIRMLRLALKAGFTASQAIQKDAAFGAVRKHPEFERLLREATSVEESARRALEQAGGTELFGGRSTPAHLQ